MAQKRRFVWGLLALAGAGAVFLSFQGGPDTSSPPLQKIAPTQDWQLGYASVFDTDPYGWLDSHEIIFFGGDSMRGYQPTVLDTQTQTSHPEPGLNAVQQGHFITASPDGQWVLWNMQTFSTSKPGMAATRRSDGKTVRWPGLQTDRSTGFWLPDSRRWVSMMPVNTGKMIGKSHVYADKFVVYSVDHPSVQTYGLPDVRTTTSWWENGAVKTVLSAPAPPEGGHFQGDILGTTPQGHMIIARGSPEAQGPPGGTPPPFSLSEMTLSSTNPVTRDFQITLPQASPSNYGRIALSPQGDRLLWTCFSNRPASLQAWFDKLVHHAYSGATESLDVWICPLNEKPPRHLGTWSGSRLGNCRWNPDGRHLSFVKDQALYQVSTD